MDVITFHHDTVLSDVHMLRPSARHLMTRLNGVGQPVFISRYKILSEAREGGTGGGTHGGTGGGTHGGTARRGETLLDEDGDLDVTHRPRKNLTEERDETCPLILKQEEEEEDEEEEEEEDRDDEDDRCVIRIEHTMATPLEDVGKQVWRGAFLLADFILSEAAAFRGATVLELGAGTGLTGIVMATTAKTVYCTDVGDDLLTMCRRNAEANRRLTDGGGRGGVKVRRLDWLQQNLCTKPDVDFGWSEEEVADLYDNTSVIMAADVCYDDELTDGLFATLRRLCAGLRHACAVFISIERRMNFTLRHMDVSCEAYDHFTRRLWQLQDDAHCSFSVRRLPADFRQFLLYERVEQLELWKVTATPRPQPRPRPDSTELSGCRFNKPPANG